MKKLNLFNIVAMLLLLSVLTSCEAITRIFKAGMGFGIIIVIAIIAVLFFIFNRKNKE